MSLADVKTELLLVCFLQTFLPDDTHDSSVILCFVETSAFGCADTGGMTCLGVNCVQGTAGLLPLSSHTHTHTFIHPKILIHTHPYSTQMQGSTGQRSNASDEREKRRGANETRTSAVSNHTADRDDRQEVDDDGSFCVL